MVTIAGIIVINGLGFRENSSSNSNNSNTSNHISSNSNKRNYY